MIVTVAKTNARSAGTAQLICTFVFLHYAKGRVSFDAVQMYACWSLFCNAVLNEIGIGYGGIKIRLL